MSHRARLAARGTYRAAIPAQIARLPLTLPPEVSAAAEDAVLAISRFDAAATAAMSAPGRGSGASARVEEEPQELGPLSTILLRTESASSSQIEDITAGAKALALASMGERAGPNAAKVAANVEAMLAAGRLASDLAPESVLAAHAALMHDQPHASPGRWRESAVWIGGHAPTAHTATFVPPQPSRIHDAIADLMALCARTDLPVLTLPSPSTDPPTLPCMTERTMRWRFDGDPMVFPSLESFEDRTETPPGNIQIDEGLPIHLHWTPKDSNVTVVTFTGSVSKDHEHVPSFTGYTMSRGIDANILMISDPTLILDRSLMLAWYQGSLAQPELPQLITRIIRSVAGDDRIVLFGSSGGGYAALDQARRLPGSTAIASNPQTDLRRYWPSPVNEYLRTAWYADLEHLDQLPSGPDGPSISMVDAYRDPVECDVIYVQGAQDAHHITHHQRPFLAAIDSSTRLIQRSADFGPGHAPGSREAFRRLITAAVKTPDKVVLNSRVAEMTLDTAALKPAAKPAAAAKKTVTAAASARGVRWAFGDAPTIFSSLSEFLTREQTPQGNIQIEHGLPLQFYWEDNGADCTFVTFQGNVNARFTTVPVYTGFTTTDGLKANRLLLSDPTIKISKDLSLAWYAGSSLQRNLQMKLTNIITSLAAGTRVVLFGASGGGFAALEQSTRVPGSTVLAMNPQTDVSRYLESAYRKYLARAWSMKKLAPSPAQMPFNHSVVDAFARPVPANVVYVQNRSDTFHIENHQEPFLKALHPQNRVLTISTDLPGRHVIPDKPSMRRLYEAVVDGSTWEELTETVPQVPLVLTN
ncbi:hypothetical protein GCM10009594_08100 [Kocuria palustris]